MAAAQGIFHPNGYFEPVPRYDPRTGRPNYRWWIWDYEINREVLQSDIQKYLGPQSFCLRTARTDGGGVYLIAAPRTFTEAQLEDLKKDSKDFEAEKRRNPRQTYAASAAQRERNEEGYADSDIGSPSPTATYSAHGRASHTTSAPASNTQQQQAQEQWQQQQTLRNQQIEYQRQVAERQARYTQPGHQRDDSAVAGLPNNSPPQRRQGAVQVPDPTEEDSEGSAENESDDETAVDNPPAAVPATTATPAPGVYMHNGYHWQNDAHGRPHYWDASSESWKMPPSA